METYREKYKKIKELERKVDDFCIKNKKPVRSDETIINAYDLLLELNKNIKYNSIDIDYKDPMIVQVVGNGFIEANIYIDKGKVCCSIGFKKEEDNNVASEDSSNRIYQRINNDAAYIMKRLYIRRSKLDECCTELLPEDFIKQNGKQK